MGRYEVRTHFPQTAAGFRVLGSLTRGFPYRLVFFASLLMSPPVANAQGPAVVNAELVSLEVVVRGENAARNLALTLAYLKNNAPALITSDRLTDRVDLTQERGWDAVVRLQKWPAGAYQEKLFESTFLTTDPKEGRYLYLPGITVSTEETLGVIPVSSLRGFSNPPTAAARRELCAAQGWASVIAAHSSRGTTQQTDCVVRVVPGVKLHGLAEVDASIVIRRPVYTLKFRNPLKASEVAPIRQGLAQAVGAQNVDLRLKPTTSSVKTEQRTAATPTIACPADLQSVFSPSVPLAALRKPFQASFLNGAVVLDPNLADEVINYPPTDPRFLYLAHPALPAVGRKPQPTIKISCQDILAEPPLQPGSAAHALSVASAAFGASISLSDANGKTFQVRGVSSSPDLQFQGLRYLTEAIVTNSFTGRTHTVIAALRDDRVIDREEEWTKRASRAAAISASGGAIIVSAPRAPSTSISIDPCSAAVAQQQGAPNRLESRFAIATERFPEMPRAFETSGIDFKSCRRWPACLGGGPFAAVVAPLRASGELWCEKGYVLGASVVWLAARGENVLVAIPHEGTSAGDRPRFAVASGSSFAAAVVAGVANMLQGEGQWESRDLLARLAATADLDLAANLVRFGSVNAERAVIGAEPGRFSDVVWATDPAGKSEPRRGIVEAGYKSTWKCRAHAYGDLSEGDRKAQVRREDAESKGWLALFVPGLNYDNQSGNAPKCFPIARVLRIAPSATQLSEANGIPLFNVVYLSVVRSLTSTSFAPMVLRDVAFQPTLSGQESFGCAWDGTVGTSPGRQPCLYAKYGSDPAVPIDLRTSDISFAPLNYNKRRQIAGIGP